MAKLTFVVEVPDAKEAEVVEFAARHLGWSETNPGDPVTHMDYLSTKIAKYIEVGYQAYAASSAGAVAIKTAEDAAKTVVITKEVK